MSANAALSTVHVAKQDENDETGPGEQGFYDQDTWDLTTHPRFSALTDRQRQCVRKHNALVEFPTEGNRHVIAELKRFCADLIESGSQCLTTFSTRISGLLRVAHFVGQEYPTIHSILEVGLDELIEGMQRYLAAAGYTICETGRWISAEMKLVERQYPARTIVSLRCFHKFTAGLSGPPRKFDFEKDSWDIRSMPSFVKGFDPSSRRYTITFAHISQPGVRTLAKRFTWQQLHSKKVGTCLVHLEAIVMLSRFLREKHPEVTDLAGLDGLIIEEWLGHVQRSLLSQKAKVRRLGAIRIFCDTCRLNEWDGAPRSDLFLSQDFRNKSRKLPKPIEDCVLRQLNANLGKLPIQMARMILVLQAVGMRPGELCLLTSDCLKQDSDGDYFLEYLQPKSDRTNQVPIDEEIALVISAAIAHSREDYGEKARYVFSQSVDKPIQQQKLIYHLNSLSLQEKITGSDGRVFRFTLHRFRHSVATRYLNLGLDLNVVRALLGHTSIGSVGHYAEIYDREMVSALQSMLDSQDEMIRLIGTEHAPSPRPLACDTTTPLPNGECAKPKPEGPCLHANSCYPCAMFIPLAEDIAIYRAQLEETYRKVQLASLHGFDRLRQTYEGLAEDLERIIARVERGGE